MADLPFMQTPEQKKKSAEDARRRARDAADAEQAKKDLKVKNDKGGGGNDHKNTSPEVRSGANSHQDVQGYTKRLKLGDQRKNMSGDYENY